jgi:fluoride ion exporter CrcB/FEX
LSTLAGKKRHHVMVCIMIISSLYPCSQNFSNDWYGPFIEVYGDQTYLMSNIVGCFIMAFAFTNMKSLTDFNPAFYKFLTTGLCGSLTTFSSWMVTGTADGVYHNFFAMLTMIGMEFALTWCGYELGILAAQLGWQLLQYLEAPEVKEIEKPKLSIVTLSGSTLMNPLLTGISNAENGFGSAASMDVVPSDGESKYVEPERQVSGDRTRTQSAVDTVRQVSVIASAAIKKNDDIFWFACFSITALAIWICAIVDSTKTLINDKDEKQLFASIVIAPIGAWVRWYLARQTALSGLWPEMKIPTFCVNQVAVFLVAILRLFVPPTTWTSAVIAGIFGSLSTVSTLFVEINQLYLANGAYVACRYTAATFGLAIFIVQILSVINFEVDK